MTSNNPFYSVWFSDGRTAEKFLSDAKDIIKDSGYISVSNVKHLQNPNLCLDYCYEDIEDNYLGWTDLIDAAIYYHGENAASHPDSMYEVRMSAPVCVTCDDIKQKTKDKTAKAPDMVNHPAHYQSETGLEVFDVIEAFTFDLKGIEAVDTGNVIKYVCRWKKKNGLEDLEKARWYLNRLIDHVKKLEEENKK